MNSGLKVLVTGCAGFIGSHTCKSLVEEGCRVWGLDNLNDYYDPLWKKENLTEINNLDGDFTFIEGDILDEGNNDKVFDKLEPDTVVHLAARAGVRPSIEQPELYQQVNILGTLKILEQMRKREVPQMVFASSSSVYGMQEKIPFEETDAVNQPISPYAATKKSGEMLAYTYAHLYGIRTTCLRFFTVYGPAGRPDMAPYLFTQAILSGKPVRQFGDGSSKRDYTYIDDIVSGVVASVKSAFEFEIINLGNSTPVSLNEFISTIEEVTGKKATIVRENFKPGDVPVTFASVDKAKKLLGYEPRTSLKEGMTEFVQWYKEHRG